MLKSRQVWLGLPVVLAAVLLIAGCSDAQAQRSRRHQQERSQPAPEPPPLPREPVSEPEPAPPAPPPPVEQRPAVQAPAAAVAAPAAAPEPGSAPSRLRWTLALETKLMILAGLLVAVGLLLSVAFAVQALYLWLALRAMRRSAALAERNMTIAQRAFVYVRSLDWRVDGGNVRVSPTWANSGATPTRSLRISTSWKAWHGDLPADFVHTYSRPPDRLFLGPNARAEVGTILIPLRDIQAAIEQRVHVYIWGRATYEDVFEGSEPHFIEFCYRLEASGSAPNAMALSFLHFGMHNRTDEDSQRPVALDQR
jgi:hypothetical protein